MPNELDPAFLEQLRELYLSTDFPLEYRLSLIGGATILFVTVILLVRRRVLREEYTPIWIVVSICIALFSIRYDWLQGITRAMGAWDPTSIVYFFGELFLVALCLNYAVRLSRYGILIKNLGQEVAILRTQLEQLETQAREEA